MKVKYIILDDNTLIDLAGTGLEVKEIARDPQLDAPKQCTAEPVKAEAPAPVAPAAPVSFNNARFFTLYEGAEVAFTLGKKVYLDEYGVERNSNKDGYIGVLKIEFINDFRTVKTRGYKGDADDVRYFAWTGAAFAKGGFDDAAAARAMHPEALIIAVGVTDSDVQYVAAA